MRDITSFRIDLRRFERAIERLNKSTCHRAVNVPQCHTIMEIGLAGKLTAKELAERLNIDKSTVSRNVDKLVRKGLVQREIPATDRRTVLISLSTKGDAIFNDINQINEVHFQKVLEQIEPDELKVFLKVFHQLSLNI